MVASTRWIALGGDRRFAVYAGSIAGGIRARSKGGALSSVLVSPATTEQLARTFSRVFDRGIRAPVKRVPTALEVLIIADCVAVVSVMVALIDSVHVPVGYATIDDEKARRIADLSAISELVRDGVHLWPQPPRS